MYLVKVIVNQNNTNSIYVQYTHIQYSCGTYSTCIQYSCSTCTHLASIGAKLEDSILLKESVMCLIKEVHVGSTN